jgi:hypothetical protein
VRNPPQPLVRLFQRNAPHDAMNLIPFGEQELGQIAPVLSRNPGNQRLFHSVKTAYQMGDPESSAGYDHILRKAK